MTPEAQKEYIITECLVSDTAFMLKDAGLSETSKVFERLARSRPYKPGAVLDDLDKKCYEQISFLSGAGSSERIAYKQVRLWIAEFRQQQKER